MKPNRVAEFFAGIGLVRLGLERVGFETVFANDIDADKFEIYRANFGPACFHLGDIHQVVAEQIPSCELYTASFPCNDLSIAGSMAGLEGNHSSAFWGLIRLLKEKGAERPPLVLLENVPGFLMSRQGQDLADAVAALNGLGYACDVFFVDAVRFVPQSRLRLFVVGKQTPAAEIGLLTETAARPTKLIDFLHDHADLNWDIRPLPDFPRRTTTLRDVLEDLPADDPHWWNAKRAEYLFAQLSDRHLSVAKAWIAGDAISYGTAFRRVRQGRSMAELRSDGVAGCLRTPRGGSGRQILFQAGLGKFAVRLLTARECARLQGVPDSFRIDVPLSQALFGFGDAVCVPVLEWIARHYLRPALALSSAVP